MRILFALALSYAAAFGQSFEAASVRPADPKSMPDGRGGPGTNEPGQVTYTNLALSSILVRAFGMSSDQVTGPASLQQRYTIVAKIPAGTTKDQFGAMLVNLLTERFHLVLHHQRKEFQAYDLVVAKNGPKLKASSAADSEVAAKKPGPAKLQNGADGQAHLESPGMAMAPFFGARVLSTHLIARAQTIADFARFLGPNMQTHIVDKTGLTGRYDFTLDYTLDASVTTASDALDNTRPYILDSVQSQLALRLQPTKIMLDTIVVDSFDPVPTEN
jgi:uncharacterized protein (TIGR03435 family)